MKEIIDQIIKVRECQKRYFQTKSKDALNASIKEEKKIDNMLEAWKKIQELKQ